MYIYINIMLKYINYDIVFQEIPNETTLAINITNCPCHCEGCHSPYLAEDAGINLTFDTLLTMCYINNGITCVSFMGGDSEPEYINKLANVIKVGELPIKVAWYSGKQELPKDIDIKNFNFIKLGPYIEKLGGLKNPNTNQKFYEVKMLREIDEEGNPIYGLEDITKIFWK